MWISSMLIFCSFFFVCSVLLTKVDLMLLLAVYSLFTRLGKSFVLPVFVFCIRYTATDLDQQIHL